MCVCVDIIHVYMYVCVYLLFLFLQSILPHHTHLMFIISCHRMHTFSTFSFFSCICEYMIIINIATISLWDDNLFKFFSREGISLAIKILVLEMSSLFTVTCMCVKSMYVYYVCMYV